MAKVYHLVLLKFKRPDKAVELFAALGELKLHLPKMLEFHAGPYSSPEGMNQGYTHGFVMTFADEEARNEYLTHPEHVTIKDAFLPFLDAVIAFDFLGEMRPDVRMV
jgi:hypothetical protein